MHLPQHSAYCPPARAWAPGNPAHSEGLRAGPCWPPASLSPAPLAACPPRGQAQGPWQRHSPHETQTLHLTEWPPCGLDPGMWEQQAKPTQSPDSPRGGPSAIQGPTPSAIQGPIPSPLQQLKSLLPAVGLHPHSKPRQPCLPATLSPRQPIPGLGSAVPTWAAPPAPSTTHSHVLGDRGVADSVCRGRDAGLAAIAAAAAVQAGHVDAVEAVVCLPRPWGGLLLPILIRAPAGTDPAQVQALT